MSKIIDFLKKNLWFIIFLAISGAIGGYFTGVYTVQIYDPELLEEVIAQVGSTDVIILITAVQSVGYALFCGLVGRILAEKIGLWRKLDIKLRPIASVVAVSILCGCVMILSDLLFFNNFSDTLKDSYLIKPTIEYIIASVTYGGVVEEMMLRLFFMSLIAFVLMKLTKRAEPTTAQIIVANIISAVLFAAGHLPATIMTMEVNAMIIFRCFLLNGGIGLLFGRLYRRYGIQYAVLAHIGTHIISKIIWILLV